MTPIVSHIIPSCNLTPPGQIGLPYRFQVATPRNTDKVNRRASGIIKFKNGLPHRHATYIVCQAGGYSHHMPTQYTVPLLRLQDRQATQNCNTRLMVKLSHETNINCNTKIAALLTKTKMQL